MKKLFALLLLTTCLVSCTEETRYGRCIGFGDTEDPRYIYETDVGNAILGVIFIETIIVPVIWITDEAKCPVDIRDNSERS